MFSLKKPAEQFPMPIQVDQDTGHLSLYKLQGPRVISTPRDAVYYGFKLMELRIEAHYDVAAPEVKACWEGEADHYAAHPTHHIVLATDQERQLIGEIQDALRLQRQRERGEAHLIDRAILPLWISVGEKAENYLLSK